MNRLLSSAWGGSFLVLLLFSRPLPADEAAYAWEGVERIVAVGDVHGAYENFVAVLKNAGLVNDDLDWIGGETHLVQTGDLVDRGPRSRETMDLLMELEDQAEDDGGRVHALIGNHEAMNIVGILDFVSDEEFESYVDRDSRRRREAAFERYYERLKEENRRKGQETPKQSDVWEEFKKQFPLGYIEHRQAFSKDGRYGEWILKHNVAIRINGTIFSHGDFSEKFSQIGIEEVNQRVRQELKGELPLEEGLTFDPASPLQYRGLAQVPLTEEAQQAKMDLVNRILENLGGKRMVVGHTVTSGVIESRFGGKHISIDVGILELYRGGHRIALEIVGGELRAIHDGGTIPIPETMNETNIADYMRAVAEVAPKNIDVQLNLVEMLKKEGRLSEAASILERLIENPRFVPFRHHQFLGSYYQENGQPAKARRHFVAYIEGLKKLVQSHPENVNLANLLVRFCIEKRMKLDLAESVLENLLDRAPENSNFRLTATRFHLATEEFRKALDELSRIPEGSGMDYELHYLAGLAYLGLDDETRAREEFNHALRAEPDRPEAKHELDKLDGGSSPKDSKERPSASGDARKKWRWTTGELDRRSPPVRQRSRLCARYFLGGTTASLQALETRNLTTVFFGI